MNLGSQIQLTEKKKKKKNDTNEKTEDRVIVQ